MGTVPTGRLERELRKLYLGWVRDLDVNSKDVDGAIKSFQSRSEELISSLGGDIASLGALADFPAPKLLPLSPHAGTVYNQMRQAAVQASISVGLNARETASAMFRAGMDKAFYRLERVARTETVSAYWKNQWDSAAGLGLVMVWSAEFGARTCDFCLSKEGMVVPDPSTRDHPNGRCTLVPTLPSRVDYKGSVAPDGSIYYDKNWDAEFKQTKAVDVDLVAYREFVRGFEDPTKTRIGGKPIKTHLRNATTVDDLEIIRTVMKPEDYTRAVGILSGKPKPGETMSSIFKGVTKAAEDELAKYTQNSFQLNALLRSGVAPENVKLIDQALLASPLSRSARVVRVVDGDAGQDLLRTARSGGVYTDKAYLSTQKHGFWDADELVENFAVSGGKPVVMDISLPKGFGALDISGKLDKHPLALGYNQGEVLLPRGVRFRTANPVDMGDYWSVKLTPEIGTTVSPRIKPAVVPRAKPTTTAPPSERPHVSMDTAPDWTRDKLAREWRFYNGTQQTDAMWSYNYDGLRAVQGAMDNLAAGRAVDDGLDLTTFFKRAAHDFYEDGVQVLDAADSLRALELAARDLLTRQTQALPSSVYRGMYVPANTEFKVGESVTLTRSSFASKANVAESYTSKQVVHSFETEGKGVLIELKNAQGFRVQPDSDWDEMLVSGSAQITEIDSSGPIMRVVATYVKP